MAIDDGINHKIKSSSDEESPWSPSEEGATPDELDDTTSEVMNQPFKK